MAGTVGTGSGSSRTALTRLRLRPTRHVELGLADGLNGPRPLLPLRREAAFMVARGRWWP